VKSTICREPTRNTAGIPSRASRAIWAYEHTPRSATSTSSEAKAGWTFGTRARSWVSKGALTSWVKSPVPA
jgi:hypothetical protein